MIQQRIYLSKEKLEFYRKLYDKKYQQKYNKFIVEGPNVVRDGLVALLDGHKKFSIAEIFTEHEFSKNPENLEILKTATKLGIPIFRIPRWQIRKISDTTAPQGIVAIVKFDTRDDDEQLNEFLNLGENILFLDGIQDPGNVGTLIRSALAFAIDGVILDKASARLYNPKVIRTTAGAFFRLPVFEPAHTKSEDIVSKFISIGFYTIAFVADRSATPVWDIKLSRKNLLILGNEGSGVKKSLLSLSHKKVWIPTNPKVESLNTAVAGSIAMFELLGRKIKVGR